MTVAIVVPARDAATTLAVALDSLLAQTFPGWEAVIVDDGSTDTTAEIAASYASNEARIRLVRQEPRGVSAARNVGIGATRSDWLLFLDADDWLLPPALERLIAAGSQRKLDAVYGGWARVTRLGERVAETHVPDEHTMFATLAGFCPFAIHACLIRRSVVDRVGGFDPSLRSCEDWDLWQRVARTGARFGAIRDVIACYRMRSGSASQNALRLLTDGLRTIDLGHGPDSRVREPHPAFDRGIPPEGRAASRLTFACWVAGLLIGRGDDPIDVLTAVGEDRAPALSPENVAQSLFKATLLPGGLGPAAWIDLWPRVQPSLHRVLDALEAQSQTAGLARSVLRRLESLVLDHARVPLPTTIGRTHAIALELTEPLRDVEPGSDIDRLRCAITIAGEHLRVIELPVCDAVVPAAVLGDAVAAETAWDVLYRLFSLTVYRRLEAREDGAQVALWRGAVRLAEDVGADERARLQQLHARGGWAVFLQELWGQPGRDRSWFYEDGPHDEPLETIAVEGTWVSFEVADQLVDFAPTAAAEAAEDVTPMTLDVQLTIGGIPVILAAVPVEDGRVRARRLLSALTSAAGFELCRIAVREAVIGQPLDETVSLRARLAEAAIRNVARSVAVPAGIELAPGWERGIERARRDGASGLLLARHVGPIGTSASRVAALPAAATQALREAAVAAGEPFIELGHGGQCARVMYAPDLLWRGSEAALGDGDPPAPHQEAVAYDRHHFESVFAEAEDPWVYDSPYERLKYAQTLSMLAPTILQRTRRALELACAEGRFTALIAPRVANLLATDISDIALRRAALRCAEYAHVRFARLDLVRDDLPGEFDLIICSEVLYFVPDESRLARVADKLARALAPGGYLIATHANCVVDDPRSGGYDWDVPFGARRIGEILAGAHELSFERELRTELYRVQVFRRIAAARENTAAVEDGPHLPPPRRAPQVATTARCLPPPPRVAANYLSEGGPVRRSTPPKAVTERLPILRYQRVAPAGMAASAPHRVPPAAFETHLQYLRQTGFYSIGLDTWRRACQPHEPLAGRAVVLTFDHAHADFLDYAAPLLAKYGFGALVLVVAERVGHVGRSQQGEDVAMLDWDDMRQLRAAGIDFGSYSATYPRLTALSPNDVTREAARSRAHLTGGLGVPILAFAYPHGAEDGAIQHLVGACGYVYGLTCRSALASLWDPLLALPRVEVLGSDTLDDFVRKLS